MAPFLHVLSENWMVAYSGVSMLAAAKVIKIAR